MTSRAGRGGKGRARRFACQKTASLAGRRDIARWATLLGLDERGVNFRYKDYRRNGQARFRTMTLAPDEFIRRFLLHVLPKGFHRIRYYGLFTSATCKTNIARARVLIVRPVPVMELMAEHNGADPGSSRYRGRPSPTMPLLRRSYDHRRDPQRRSSRIIGMVWLVPFNRTEEPR